MSDYGDRHAPTGFGACTKCSCTGYNPGNLTGVCQAIRKDGNVCAHQNNDHELN